MVEKLNNQVEGKGFEELSELLRREGKSVTGAIFEEGLKSRGAKQRLATTQVCEGCGRTLTRQPKLQSRKVESLHGEIEIERPYFYCKPRRKGSSPLEEALEIAPQKKPYDLQRTAADYLRKFRLSERVRFLNA